MGAKKLTKIDLQELPYYHFQTKTTSQQKFLKEIESNDVIIASGSAGTGKTITSIVSGLKGLFNQDYKQIIVVKPTIGSGGEDIGFLSGSADQKIFPFHYSTIFTIEELIGKEKRIDLMKSGEIKLMPIAFLRGVTFRDSFVIIDEAQNLSIEQMKLIITRIGIGSKMIFIGDEDQSDLYQSGGALKDAMERFSNLRGLSIFEFEKSEVVRHEIIGRILNRY